MYDKVELLGVLTNISLFILVLGGHLYTQDKHYCCILFVYHIVLMDENENKLNLKLDSWRKFRNTKISS